MIVNHDVLLLFHLGLLMGVLELKPPRLRRNASSSSSSCGAPGGETIRCKVDQECQDNPEPAPTGHASIDIKDEDIGQGGNRQEDDPNQGYDPASAECAVNQWGR